MSGFTKIDIDKTTFGKVVSYEVATQFRDNIELLQKCFPLGEIVPILVGIPNVPIPDANVWQECNGSEILNPNSPLRSMGALNNYTPDLRERFIKVPQLFGESGILGGLNNNYIFRHNHAGVTGGAATPEKARSGSDAAMAARDHTHTIDYSFDYAVNVEPPFFTVKWFMRIQ